MAIALIIEVLSRRHILQRSLSAATVFAAIALRLPFVGIMEECGEWSGH